MGDKVKNLKVGDRVGIPWLHSSCGECEYCSSGWETLCPNQETSGYSVDGCYRQFTTIPASHAVKLPDNKPLEEAARKILKIYYKHNFNLYNIAILCGGVTAYKSLLETEAKAGQFVCILGAAGGLGHLGIQYAKVMGFRVIAMDLGKDKVEFMNSFEPELALDVNDPDSKNRVKEYTQGGVHAVVVIATQASAFEYAIELCRNKAYIVATSMPQGKVEIDIVPLVLKRITFRGSVVGTRNDMAVAMDYFARGLIKPNISVVPFEKVNEVLDQFHLNKIQGRVVLQM